jgi:D-lactate dehydrogenase
MYGKTAGVIGTGKIGKVLISILKGFGMKVLAYDKFADKAVAQDSGFSYVDIETLYRDCDIISLNCPLNAETRYMINETSLAMMKDGVMIINTGRGQLIDTRALIEALKTGKVGAAGLDVYEEESQYFFEDFSNSFISDDILARLLTLNNVIITGHQGFLTKEALSNIALTTMNNIKHFFEENLLENEICYKCGSPNCMKKALGKCF